MKFWKLESFEVFGLRVYIKPFICLMPCKWSYYPGPGTDLSAYRFSFMYTLLKYSLERPKEKALDFGVLTNCESRVYLFGGGDATDAALISPSNLLP